MDLLGDRRIGITAARNLEQGLGLPNVVSGNAGENIDLCPHHDAGVLIQAALGFRQVLAAGGRACTAEATPICGNWTSIGAKSSI